MDTTSWAYWAPVIFMALMGLAMYLYVVLDGFDLGVGMLLPLASDPDKDTMVSSIGPFWDANETWLVMGVGVLLMAFPKAHGVILTSIYLPTAWMLIGLILRGVAFDFRVKARDQHKPLWNQAFFVGSLVTALAQGWMLGRYVTGFARGPSYTAFAACIALALASTYVLLGSTWLIMKTEGALQERAVRWARRAWVPMACGMALISVATPWVSESVRLRWFAWPQWLLLAPIPLCALVALLGVRWVLNRHRVKHTWKWVPFALTTVVLLTGTLGLAYSLFPFVVMDRMSLWQAAAALDSLNIILAGCAVTVPAILAYTAFSYWVFRGPARTPVL
ncbi:MAG: cytochrome d ubiquinol oxidase subunit II [Acidobacteriota bacterium]